VCTDDHSDSEECPQRAVRSTPNRVRVNVEVNLDPSECPLIRLSVLSALGLNFRERQSISPAKAHRKHSALYREAAGRTVRQGFLEEATYSDFRAPVPTHQVPLFTTAYYTGIRAGELLFLLWQYVDFMAEIPLIKIPGEVTKNGKPRTIPLYHPDMLEVLKFAYQTREPRCPYIFQFRGRRLKSYRTAFERARNLVRLSKLLPPPLAERIGELTRKQLAALSRVPDAEMPELFERTLDEHLTDQQIKEAIRNPDGVVSRVLFHDTRRTAIRNMERARVRRADARQISGHRTESIYLRYDIASEESALEAGTTRRQFHAQQQTKKIVRNLWDKRAGNEPKSEAANGAKQLN
jgi:integrase